MLPLHAESTDHAPSPTWADLPPLPVALGGQCVGTSGDWLIVAGGSSWTAAPWDGGKKEWSDRIYGLRKGNSEWTTLGHLPYAAGYFAAASANGKVFCAGGEDATHALSQVFQLEVDHHGKLSVTDLPNLPHPLSWARGAVTEDTLFLVGGHDQPGPKGPEKEPALLALPLHGNKQWTSLPAPWEYELVLTQVAACKDLLFVAGGVKQGKLAVTASNYLTEAWTYKPSTDHWTELPPLPHPIAGGAAVCGEHGQWIVFGGNDGKSTPQMAELRDKHPGFPKAVYVFDSHHRQWSHQGDLPISLLGSGGTLWNGLAVIPGGEDRPAHRSNRVLSMPVSAFRDSK